MTTQPSDAPSASPIAVRPVMRFRDADSSRDRDCLAVEEPLEIRLGDRPLAVTMRTPGNDVDLAAGFCFTEGLFADPDDLVDVQPCPHAPSQNAISVILAPEVLQERARRIGDAGRDLFLSSSCGICGKRTLDRIQQQVPSIRGDFTLNRAILPQLCRTMRDAQATFERTGGLHAAAVFSPDGRLRTLREDVGRHNAVDKVLGRHVLLGRTPIDPAILVVSGRASFEIMQKAAMAGIAAVAAVSAPSSLAVDFAARLDMTLIGFLRPGRMNVYHDPGRIET